MNEFLLSVSPWVGSLLIMAISIVLGLIVYLVSYKLLAKYDSEELRDPIGNLFRVIGMLVSLMLSLAFAEVVVQLRAIENAIEREAVAISDTFDDLKRFQTGETREIKTILIDYTQSIIDDDWPALAGNQLGNKTGDLNKKLQQAAMNLEPTTEAQKQLWSRILNDLDVASDYRLIRLDNALGEPPIYLYVVFFGFLLTMACFGTYRPQGPVVVLVSMYALFVGMVLYLILVLSDPFHGGFGIEPTTFEHVIERMQSEMNGP